MSDTLAAVADLIRHAKRVLFITGAGLSADSGLPTYRGVGGLYDSETTEHGMPIEEALSGAMFQIRPEITWKYLWQIGSACAGATFNRGHEVIAEIERQKPESCVLTQNIDGFHRAAGSRNLIEVHGRMSELTCVACGKGTTAQTLLRAFAGEPELPPRCPECGGIVRPDVVLFGEMLPDEAVSQLNELLWLDPDLVMVVGTSGVFPYVIEPVTRARSAGRATVDINPTRSELSAFVDHHIESTAADTLDGLWQMAQA